MPLVVPLRFAPLAAPGGLGRRTPRAGGGSGGGGGVNSLCGQVIGAPRVVLATQKRSAGRGCAARATLDASAPVTPDGFDAYYSAGPAAAAVAVATGSETTSPASASNIVELRHEPRQHKLGDVNHDDHSNAAADAADADLRAAGAHTRSLSQLNLRRLWSPNH